MRIFFHARADSCITQKLRRETMAKAAKKAVKKTAAKKAPAKKAKKAAKR